MKPPALAAAKSTAPSLRRLRMATVVLVASFAALVVAAGIYSVVQQYNAAVDAAARAARNTVLATRAHASQTFGETFHVLQGISDVYLYQIEHGRLNERELHDLLESKLGDIPGAITFFILDENRDGVAGAYSVPLDMPRLFGTGISFDRMESVGSGQVVVPVYKNVSPGENAGVWYLPVGVEVWDKTDTFRGHVFAILDTRYFSNYYGTLDVGGHGRIGMWTAEGRLVAANANESANPGDVSPDAAKQIEAQRQRPANDQEITFITDGGSLDEVIAPARLGDLPLFLSVTLCSEDFLSTWRVARTQVMVAIVVIVLAVGAFAIVLLRQLKRSEQNEVALRQAKAVAEEANDAKSRFLAHMSHEFRTPLNAIMGFSEIIKNRVLGDGIAPAYTSYADHIHRSGEHLLNIVNDILDMAKIESGAQPLLHEAIDMRGVITSVVTFIEGLATQKGIHIRVVAPAHLPWVSGDQRFSRQVVINLLSNAIKFSPPNAEIVVAARHVDGKYLDISVNDRGPGIEPSLLKRLGEPFLQGNPSVSQSGQGTGLGLSICKRYMDLLGGELLIDSTVGAGTTAIVRFPQKLLIDPPSSASPARSVA